MFSLCLFHISFNLLSKIVLYCLYFLSNTDATCSKDIHDIEVPYHEIHLPTYQNVPTFTLFKNVLSTFSRISTVNRIQFLLECTYFSYTVELGQARFKLTSP